jgi:hypothetical protein
MKYLLATLALCCMSTNITADLGPYSDIERFLQNCHHEPDLPLTRSASHSGYFYVGKSHGHYTLNIDIQLRYPAHFSQQEFMQARQIFEQVKTWITQYYADYGILLDIDFDHARYNPSASNPHPTPPAQSFVVYVRNRTGSHMKELYWGVNPQLPIDRQATVIAHEFSHLLRLKDEYFAVSGARTLQEEAGYEDDSLMKNVDHPRPRLYLRHIKKILGPLCRPTEAIIAQESMRNYSLYP